MELTKETLVLHQKKCMLIIIRRMAMKVVVAVLIAGLSGDQR